MLTTLFAISLITRLCFQSADGTLRLDVPNHMKLTANNGSAKQRKEAARVWEQAIAENSHAKLTP
jgi:hypothetical protein